MSSAIPPEVDRIFRSAPFIADLGAYSQVLSQRTTPIRKFLASAGRTAIN